MQKSTVVTIASARGIAYAAKNEGIQPGDALFFRNASGIVSHAAIITKVENGMIYYAAHTDSYFDKALSEGIGSQGVYIVKIGY